MKTDSEYGYIKFKLTTILENKNLSKNQLSFKAEIQRGQINKYCKGEVTRLDFNVLCRLCCALNCGIDEIIEYVPYSNKQLTTSKWV